MIYITTATAICLPLVMMMPLTMIKSLGTNNNAIVGEEVDKEEKTNENENDNKECPVEKYYNNLGKVAIANDRIPFMMRVRFGLILMVIVIYWIMNLILIKILPTRKKCSKPKTKLIFQEFMRRLAG